MNPTLPVLSRTPKGLQTIYLSPEDQELFTQTTFQRGKKEGQTYLQVLERDPGYLRWMKERMGEEVTSPALKRLLSIV
jgi:hypothetical protein